MPATAPPPEKFKKKCILSVNSIPYTRPIQMYKNLTGRATYSNFLFFSIHSSQYVWKIPYITATSN
jgi:hypothetical protein